VEPGVPGLGRRGGGHDRDHFGARRDLPQGDDPSLESYARLAQHFATVLLHPLSSWGRRLARSYGVFAARRGANPAGGVWPSALPPPQPPALLLEVRPAAGD